MFNYTSLFFDLDYTLWDFKSNSTNALLQTLKHFEFTKAIENFHDFEQDYNAINDKLWQQYRERTIRKDELTRSRFEQSLKKFSQNGVIDGNLVNDTYLDYMAQQTTLIDGAKEILDLFYGKVKMAIITNGFRKVQLAKLKTAGIDKYFDKVIISEVVGSPKPSKNIFQEALKSTNSKKSNSIMIGDSWDADIIGARNFGIDQIYFNPESQFTPNEKSKSTTFFIQHLSQIAPIILS